MDNDGPPDRLRSGPSSGRADAARRERGRQGAVQPGPPRQGAARQGAASPASRRGFLLGGALGVVAAGAGVAVGLARSDEPDEDETVSPQRLLAAVAAERALIRSIDAARASAADAGVLRQLRADHVAHLSALRAAVVVAGGDQGSSTAPAGRSDVTPVSRAQLRTMEQRAATRAAKLALELRGRDAVLLASIAACEATHAELLT